MSGKRKYRETIANRLVAVACVAAVAAALVGGGCYGAWRLAMRVSHGALAAWALVATVGIPVALFAGYRLGGVESRGVLAGLGLGVGQAVETAARVADVKVGTARAMRQTVTEVVDMPSLPPVHHYSSLADDGEVIEI